MEVVFSQRAIAAVMAETAEKIQTETGGLFLGKVIGDTWYVCLLYTSDAADD